jgi:hypothetical protein
MKLKKCFLLALITFGLSISNAANATDWDWGGYVSTTDSPVIGGFAVNEQKNCQSISTGIMGQTVSVCSEIPSYFGVVAFGKVAYTGALNTGQWYGGSYSYITSNSNVIMTCPANTAPIKVASPYVRSDGVTFNPYVYKYPWGTMGAYATTVTLCVKTDTY